MNRLSQTTTFTRRTAPLTKRPATRSPLRGPRTPRRTETATERLTLADAWRVIQGRTFVDMTHAFEPGIPHWKGFPNEQRQAIYTYEPTATTPGEGFVAETYAFVGQWGTHVDPPSHFVPGLRSVDEIDVKEMVLPLVILDVHEEVAKNPDYTITMPVIWEWEAKHGRIPKGAFVALRTDWSKRWPDWAAMRNTDADGVDHYPGWSQEVLTFLYEERHITASGHEQIDTDPGIAASHDDYSLEIYILAQNCFQIELLCNLDKLPEAGALVVAAFPKPKNGSGFPARVFAILP